MRLTRIGRITWFYRKSSVVVAAVKYFTYCVCFAERSWLRQADGFEHLLPVQQIALVLSKDVGELLYKSDAEIMPGLGGLGIRPAKVIAHAIELVIKGLGSLMIKSFEVGEEEFHRMIAKFTAGQFPWREMEFIAGCTSGAMPVIATLMAFLRELTLAPGSLGLFLDCRRRPKEVVF
jgi:hypothetical protein